MREEQPIRKLDAWLKVSGVKGYDPYDALSSPLVASLDKRWHLGGRLAIQSLKYFPINLRGFLGIRPAYDAKALGLLIRAYFFLAETYNDSGYLQKAQELLRLLEQMRNTTYSGACWSHDFPYRSSRLYLPAGYPSVVSTVYAAQAFLDAYETWGKQEHLAVARSACTFLLQDIERIGPENQFCFSYLPGYRLAIHNASLLAAQLLARVASITGDDWLDIIRGAINYTLQDQNPDGSWLYDGPDSPNRRTTFIDGFHTGFVLESLWDIAQGSGIDLYPEIRKGLDFYIEHLFSPGGVPQRMVGKQWPLDLRDCAQAMIVLSKLSGWDRRTASLYKRVLIWTEKNMQAASGFFYFVRSGWYVSPIPYLRFQAWMLCALASGQIYLSEI